MRECNDCGHTTTRTKMPELISPTMCCDPHNTALGYEASMQCAYTRHPGADMQGPSWCWVQPAENTAQARCVTAFNSNGPLRRRQTQHTVPQRPRPHTFMPLSTQYCTMPFSGRLSSKLNWTCKVNVGTDSITMTQPVSGISSHVSAGDQVAAWGAYATGFRYTYSV